MSGFAGVFHLDGAPLDRAWLEAMADFMGFRGPDGSQVWASESAGLCHTLLRVAKETDGRSQIASLDGCLWIAADARVDDRETLLSQLPSVLSRALRAACSAELILHSYATWGEACVQHLLGDFSFVIWDAPRQRIFAARDHLGVRPLFYAQVGQCLLVSNTLDCIRQIPTVSNELNEQAIGDFLIAGRNFNPDTSFFANIKRLPVAHRLIAGAGGLRVERYWTLPIDEPLYYRRTGDYVDRFQELLRAAVGDRLPDGPLGIFMSGGLDSPAVAATAVQLGASVCAFTSVYDRLIPDQERHYSGLVAEHLRIPIHYEVRDDEPWGWEPGSVPFHTPEPSWDPTSMLAYRQHLREISAEARVFFWGDGPDAALWYEWRPHVTYLMRQRRWGRLCQDLASHLKAFKRVPLLPTLPRMWRERRSNQPDLYQPSFPEWLNPEFEAQLSLRERFHEIQRKPRSPHPIRENGYACFANDFPMGLDGGNGGCPGDPAIDHLHPLWDLRLLRFLLAIPAVPWCREKYLIRAALKGVLPEAVRRRAKAPLAGLPYLVRARQSSRPELPPSPKFARYVDITRLPQWPGRNREEIDQGLRALGLHFWLLSDCYALP